MESHDLTHAVLLTLNTLRSYGCFYSNGILQEFRDDNSDDIVDLPTSGCHNDTSSTERKRLQERLYFDLEVRMMSRSLFTDGGVHVHMSGNCKLIVTDSQCVITSVVYYPRSILITSTKMN